MVIDALVKLENGDVLYSGILAGYELAADGGLRTIYIHSARRKQLTTTFPEQATLDAYYPVDGHLLTLPYEQLLNLNISYFMDEQDARAEGDERPVAGEAAPQITLTDSDKSATSG